MDARGEPNTNFKWCCAHKPVCNGVRGRSVVCPLVSLRSGKFKYNQCKLDPEQLFDLENDLNEKNNLVGQPNTRKH